MAETDPIHGWNFGNVGRTFRLDGIQIFGRALPSGTSLSLPVLSPEAARMVMTVPGGGNYRVLASETLGEGS